MAEIREALGTLGDHALGLVRGHGWGVYLSTIPEPHFWFTASPLFTIGSFALFAIVGFSGIARVSRTYRGILICGYIAAVILFLLGWWQAAQQEKAAAATQKLLATLANPKPLELPDITMRLVDPESPAIQIINTSNAVAHTVRYSSFLFNIDANNHDESLLKVPTSGPDFIRPHSVDGLPSVLFGSLALPYLKAGDRIFGTISLLCPECKRGRTFLIFIVWEKGGWFSELTDIDDGKGYLPPKGQKYWNVDVVNQITDSIPTSSRIEIKDREHVDINSP